MDAPCSVAGGPALFKEEGKISRTEIECPYCLKTAEKGEGAGGIIYDLCQACLDIHPLKRFEVGQVLLSLRTGSVMVIYSVHHELLNIKAVTIGGPITHQITTTTVTKEYLNLSLAVLDGETHREWPG